MICEVGGPSSNDRGLAGGEDATAETVLDGCVDQMSGVDVSGDGVSAVDEDSVSPEGSSSKAKGKRKASPVPSEVSDE